MARTNAGAVLTREHRRQQLALRSATLGDLLRLWRVVDPLDLGGTIGRFVDAGVVLVRARNRDSAGLALRYFTAFRRAEGLPGRAEPFLAATLDSVVAAGALRGAGLRGVVDARSAGFTPAAAVRQGLVAVQGQASSLVLDGGRRTILETARRDPQARRWQRVTGSDACAFCAMLASRGAVFRTEEVAGFESHDHCACSVEVAYEGADLPPPSDAHREEWDRAQREARDAGELRRGTSNDALNAFRRARSGG